MLFLSLYTGLHCILHQRVQVCFYISSLLRVLPGETRLNSDKLYATKFPFFPPCFINKSQKYPSLKFLSHANTGLIFAIFTQTKFSRTEEGLENPADIYINIKVFLPSAIDKALEYHRTCFLSNIPHHLNLVPWPWTNIITVIVIVPLYWGYPTFPRKNINITLAVTSRD